MQVLLFATLGIPVAAALLMLLFRGTMGRRFVRWVALVSTVLTLLVSLGLANAFRQLPSDAEVAPGASAEHPIVPRFEATFPWMSMKGADAAAPNVVLEFEFGLDAVSVAGSQRRTRFSACTREVYGNLA